MNRAARATLALELRRGRHALDVRQALRRELVHEPGVAPQLSGISVAACHVGSAVIAAVGATGTIDGGGGGAVASEIESELIPDQFPRLSCHWT